MDKELFLDHQIKRVNRNIIITIVSLALILGCITWFLYYYDLNTLGFWIFSGLTVLTLIIGIYKYYVIHDKTHSNSIIKSLERYENQNILDFINSDVKSGTKTYGRVLVSSNWFFQKRIYGLDVINTAEIIWVYKKKAQTKHYINFIPVGSSYSYSIVIHFIRRNRKGDYKLLKIEYELSDDKVNELLKLLSDVAPWSLFGYTEDIKMAVFKDTLNSVNKVLGRVAVYKQITQ